MGLLEVKSLRKTYGNITALRDGNMICREGSVCGLLGANGSGKSTFSKMISGVVKPDGGEIRFNGEVIHFSSPEDAMRKGIIMVHQHLSLIPELTIWENMTLGAEPVRNGGFLQNKESQRIAQEFLSKFSSTLSIHMKVKDLSIAQKQFVEIAKAISKKPKLLILDEPTAPLEQSEVAKLFAVIHELKKKNTSIIFISHRLWEIKSLCDHVVVFRNGETVGHIDFETDGKNDRQIISMISGTEPAEGEHSDKLQTIRSEETMLEIKDLTRGKVFENVNLTIKKGEIVGIGGLQGQGQEELLLGISGLLRKDAGKIELDGTEINLKHPKQAVRAGMVLVPGDRHKEGLFLQHSVLLNLIFPQLSTKKTGFFLNMKKFKAEANEVMNRVDIVPRDSAKLVQFLSGGNQQKVVVGKWLPLSPKVLLLSDPTKGVDIGAKRELYDTVRALARSGTSVLLYASDNEELMDVCDRVLIMFEGRIVDEIQRSEYSEERFISSSMLSTNA
jgi:ribose transport system ATP-binding protein